MHHLVIVRACVTVDEEKTAVLTVLPGAAERLTMVQVDLLDRASLRAAFDGCDGVIHTASPMHDTPVSSGRSVLVYPPLFPPE